MTKRNSVTHHDSLYTTPGVFTNYLAHNFRIITTATTWIKSSVNPQNLGHQPDSGYIPLNSDMQVRKHFAWVSDINYIKWNNLAIINPAKYQGINMQ